MTVSNDIPTQPAIILLILALSFCFFYAQPDEG